MESYHNHIKTIVFSMMAFLFMPVSAIAQSGELLVEAQLDPFISVTPVNPIVKISTSDFGDFSGTFGFLIESNTANVSLYAIVTKLYKDTNPSNTEVKPIDVNVTTGVDISPFAANASTGSDLNAAFVSTSSLNKPNGMFDSHQTEQVNLESTQGMVFDQDVELTVTWTRDATVRPAGVYGGYIKLYVSAVP